MLLRAVVIRPKGPIPEDLEKRASLLRLDSVHGKVCGTADIAAICRSVLTIV